MKWLLSLLFTYYLSYLQAQNTASFEENISNRPLDTNAFRLWPKVDFGAISNDGRYAAYTIVSTSRGFILQVPDTLVIKSIYNDWIARIPRGAEPRFLNDNRHIIYRIGKDTLSILTLKEGDTEIIPHISTYNLFTQGNIQWLLYEFDTASGELHLRNINKRQDIFYCRVKNYCICHDGSTLILNTGNNSMDSLWMVKLESKKENFIWSGQGLDEFVVDREGNQMAFKSHDNQGAPSVMYYREGSEKVKLLVNNASIGLDSGMEIGSLEYFSIDGTRLFFNMIKRVDLIPNPSMVKVDVWTYRDAVLQSEQEQGAYQGASFESVIDIKNGHIIVLQGKEDASYRLIDPENDNWVVANEATGSIDERIWSRFARSSAYLVSTRDGKRKHTDFADFQISPDGKYLLGNNIITNDLYSYEIENGFIYNISKSIPIKPIVDDHQTLTKNPKVLFLAWVGPHSSFFLARDKFDIWELDAAGRSIPVNLTNGFGRRHSIEFDLTQHEVDSVRTRILLNAFDTITKKEGYYYCILNKSSQPVKICMENEDFDRRFGVVTGFFEKARDTDVYLIKKGNAQESSNYFWTTDFIHFSPISSIYPERSFNWLRTELFTFLMRDGKRSQGILYKPDNFNPRKKYPVIIHYYERKSDNLNVFPDLFFDDELSIPWFVSHGYLVFTPDIHYAVGKTGASALNAVLGATDFLVSNPWVDKQHIGIEGHSFGGFETNFIITHSKRFAAAISACGTSDAILEYSDLWGTPRGGSSKEGYFEYRQGYMGCTLWENPRVYLDNSPILRADKIVTPLLLMANINDIQVHFIQGLELYLGLRRLGKKVWMLQYDDQGHGVSGKAFVDFTLRSQQFFDFYLKGMPPPKWMIEGIPAKWKGIDDGLNLEPIGTVPGPGILIEDSMKGPSH